ncbi:MAG: hypothetical protein R3F39_01255 [Myxococcota bacterium]
MGKTIRAVVLLAVFLIPLGASSASWAKQRSERPATHSIGADFLFVVPVGDYADITNVGFGLLGRYELRLIPEFALTGRVGFVGHVAKKVTNNLKLRTWELPVLVGGRYYSKIGIWAGAELGLVVMGFRASFPNTQFSSLSRTDTDAKFGIMLSGGYRWRDLDFGVALFVPDIDDYLGITFTVGYTFAKFGK